MAKSKLCTMCGLNFIGRDGAKTCSPRCRKRRERIRKGIGTGTWAMLTRPNEKASKLWR